MRRKTVAFASVAAVGLALAGCGKKDEPPPPPPTANTVPQGPAWIDNHGLGMGQPGDLFAAGMCDARRASDRGLQRTAAQEDARTKLALALQSRVSALIKNYQRAISDLVKEPLSESDISNTAQTFTDTTLSGVQFVESWRDPQTGDFHVLAKIPFDKELTEKLKNQIDQALAGKITQASAAHHAELERHIQEVQKNGWPK